MNNFKINDKNKIRKEQIGKQFNCYPQIEIIS